MADILENAEADLTPLMRNLIDTLWDELKLVEPQIEELNHELERISLGATQDVLASDRSLGWERLWRRRSAVLTNHSEIR
jgi:hypothetical protein